MNEIIYDTYITALPIILGYIVWLLKGQHKRQDANSKGTMLLLRAQLIKEHDQWMTLKYITKNGYDNFCEMYEAYHNLGGNSMVTRMFEEIKTLPIK